MKRRKPKQPQALEARPEGLFQRTGATRFCGAVWDKNDLERKFVVEFLVDGFPIEHAVADASLPSLKQAAGGSHGFSFEIDAGLLSEANVAEARLANLGTPVGLPLLLHGTAVSTHGISTHGPLGIPLVQWLGGLRFSGAFDLADGTGNGQKQIVKAIIEGETVAEATFDCWQNNGLLGKDALALQAFNLYLPRRFADGCVHHVHFIGGSDQPLPGSPVTFAAFADGLTELVAAQGAIESQRVRAEMFDQLMPMSLPFSRYADWRRSLPKPPQAKNEISAESIGVVLVGEGNEETSLATLEAQTHANWVGLSLPYIDSMQGLDCNALRAFLANDAASCGIVLFARAGFEFEPDAIARLSGALAAHPGAFAAYGDLTIRDSRGQAWPIAFSAFDYERLLEQGYCCALFAVRQDRLAGAIRKKSLNLFHLFNSLVSDPKQADILHVPGSFGTIGGLNSAEAGRALVNATAAHLRERHIPAKVSLNPNGQLFPAARIVRQPGNPCVSIMIPVRNRLDLLRKCLDSIAPAVKKNAAEIIIIDNDSSEPEMLAFLAGFERPKRRVLHVPGPFNYSKLNNLAAEAASGDYLCLLNNDVQALDGLWLNELLSRCAEPDVAAAGALLIWPSGVVQHGGVVLGSNFGATHAFNDRLATDSGYADLLLVARECSAVTAACLLTRRVDYLAVGGLDDILFPINFNDVDFCLKLRARGKRIIFTPHARLLHLESSSRGDHQAAHRKRLFERELRSLRTRWGEALLADPFYSPMLSLDPVPFSALAVPYRPMNPRWHTLPDCSDIPPGM